MQSRNAADRSGVQRATGILKRTIIADRGLNNDRQPSRPVCGTGRSHHRRDASSSTFSRQARGNHTAPVLAEIVPVLCPNSARLTSRRAASRADVVRIVFSSRQVITHSQEAHRGFSGAERLTVGIACIGNAPGRDTHVPGRHAIRSLCASPDDPGIGTLLCDFSLCTNAHSVKCICASG